MKKYGVTVTFKSGNSCYYAGVTANSHKEAKEKVKNDRGTRGDLLEVRSIKSELITDWNEMKGVLLIGMQRIYKMEVGCVFDNHRGIYMGEAIIELAKSYGFIPESEEDEKVSGEFHWDVVSCAEHFLDENVAEEGHMFGYGECGDFMYMPISWWSEE